MPSQKNMWGEINMADLEVTPITILKQQSDILENATAGVLIGEVITNRNEFGDIIMDLYVVAPMVGHYRHNICTVTHGIAPYPATLQTAALNNGKSIPCKTKAAFENVLEKALQAPDTKKAVSSLLAHSRAVASM